MKRATATKSTRSKAAAPPRHPASPIGIKRVYDSPEADDGVRVLIDRLWPRGLSKAQAKLDVWPKELSPSNELRKWYRHDPKLFAEFRRRYRAELADYKDSLGALRATIAGRKATLLTATRELELSHGVVLRELLEGKS
jgi:uncharacterized protein YeaO (DUF488 family)